MLRGRVAEVPTAPSVEWGGKRLGPKGRLPETSPDLIEFPTHLHSIFVSIRVSQEVCENYIRSN